MEKVKLEFEGKIYEVKFKKPTMSVIEELLQLRHEFIQNAKKIDNQYPELIEIAGQEIPPEKTHLVLLQDELNTKAVTLNNIYNILQFQVIMKWDDFPEEWRDADARKWELDSEFWKEQDMTVIKEAVAFFRGQAGC